MSNISHLTGVRDIADLFDVFFLDIFGLLHNGLKIYSGTVQALEELKASGKMVCLLSNTPRLPDNVRNDLIDKGIPAQLYNDIVTAGLSARHELERKHRGKKIWFSGKPQFHGFIEKLDLHQVENAADADLIVNAISGETPATDKNIYMQLEKGLAGGIPMICANPDMIVHIGRDEFLCGGTYAAWYEKNGGTVSYHGKPHQDVYNLALQKTGNPHLGRVCAIGDALHTDIQGANKAGIAGIWVLGGIHWEELRLKDKPEHPDLDRIRETLTITSHKPFATLSEFCW